MRKNVISLLLALVMLVSLTACGGDTPASDETDAAAIWNPAAALPPPTSRS